MRDREPVKDLLLFLGADCLVFEEKVKERRLLEDDQNIENKDPVRSIEADGITHLWFLERGIHAWFEVSEITEYTFFEFLHVSDWSSKSLYMVEWLSPEKKKKSTYFEAKHEGSDDICARDMIEAVP